MTRNEVTRLTKELEIMAIMNRSASNGAVTARRVDCKHGGTWKRHLRIDWFINGNRVTRKDAAQFLA